MVAVAPGGNNTFVPSHEASRKMVIDFARNPKSFVVNDYTQIVNCPQRVGYYLRHDFDESGRVQNDEGLEYLWPEGEDAPSGRDGTKEHEYLPFVTRRLSFPFLLPDLAVKQATWDIVASHAGSKAQQAMTVRTMQALAVATNPANHLPDHILDIQGGGVPGSTGSWAASTTARMTIKRSLNEAMEKILDTTLAAVTTDDLKLVLPDQLAKQISVCQEIVDYLKQSPFALAQVKGELRSSNPNAEYGLPEKLYGVQLCVEKTRRRTNKRGSARRTVSVLPTATPFVTARPGSLEGTYGSPSFSSMTCFAFEEMTTETKKDPDNRRVSGRIVEDYRYVMTAPEATVLFQNAV